LRLQALIVCFVRVCGVTLREPISVTISTTHACRNLRAPSRISPQSYSHIEVAVVPVVAGVAVMTVVAGVAVAVAPVVAAVAVVTVVAVTWDALGSSIAGAAVVAVT
jgi:hypothetical protein